MKVYLVSLMLSIPAESEEDAIEEFCECLSRNEFGGNDITAEEIRKEEK